MFGFLKKKEAPKPARKPQASAKATEDVEDAAPEDAGPSTPRTPELDRKFADRPTNANVAALVHLYAATRLLELLVRRGVINFGEGVTKSDEATALAKANLSFINELTTAHAQHATDFEEFRVGIQDRASATARKLSALLRAADQRVGSPDSELAEGLPWPAKTHIAMALDGFAALFGVDNPETEACKRMRDDATPMEEEEAHRAFVDEMLDAIARGNGAKAFTFIRMAGFSLGHLSATPDGRSAVADRIAKSIAEHGALDSSLISFDDVPDDVETSFENPNALFAEETIGLQRRAAAYAAAAAAFVGWMRASFAANADVAVALASAGVASGEDGSDAEKTDVQFDLLAKQIADAGQPIVAAGGKVESVSTLGPLRDALKTLAAALAAVAKAKDLALQDGGDALDLAIARYFAGSAAATFGAAAKGEAVLNDRAIRHSDKRPPGFDAALSGLDALGEAEADKLQSDFAMARNMLEYFSHHAFAAAAK